MSTPPTSISRQWRELAAELPEQWGEARLALSVADESRRARAAALLAPLAPGRSGGSFRVSAVRGRAGASPGAVARALSRLDAERIRGELRLVAVDDLEAPEEAPRETLLGAWERELDRLPSDWSDAWVEVQLGSSDLLERAALHCSALNPARTPDGLGFRFRAARRAGYGVPPDLVRRCLRRLDAEGMQGGVAVLRALSDTSHSSTQGPVWYVEGKVV